MGCCAGHAVRNDSYHHGSPLLDRSFGDGYDSYTETTTVTTHHNNDPDFGKSFGANGIAYPPGMGPG